MVTLNIFRTCEGKHDLSVIHFRGATVLNLNKCLKQIKSSIFPYAPISELPSNIGAITKYTESGPATLKGDDISYIS